MNKPHVCPIVARCLIFLCATVLRSGEIIFQPGPGESKDIWTTSQFSYAPGGSGPGGGRDDEWLRVGGWGDQYFSFIEFDLTELPTVAEQAEIQLFVGQSMGVGQTQMYLDRITEFWDWKTQGSGRDRERLWWADRPMAQQWGGVLPAPAVGEWYTIDITELYNGWQSVQYPSFGMQLRPVSTANQWNEFYSSDYTDSSLRPRLVIRTTKPACVLYIPILKQYDVRWATSSYGAHPMIDDDKDGRVDEDPKDGLDNDNDGDIDEDTPETIRKWGCTLTAACMVVNYYAERQGVAFQTTPLLLNDWLITHAGYNPDDGVRLWRIPDYALENGITFYYQTPMQRNDELLDTYLCRQEPAILKVKDTHGDHYVIATGKSPAFGSEGYTYTLTDPGYSSRPTLEYYGNTYSTFTPFSTIPPSAAGLQISGHSPINLLLSDDLGRRVGVDLTTGELLQEMPGAIYTIDALSADDESGAIRNRVPVIQVAAPPSQSFTLYVLGTGSGKYTLAFSFWNNDDSMFSAELGGVTALGLIDHFEFRFDPDASQPVPEISRSASIASLMEKFAIAISSGAISNSGIARSLLAKLESASKRNNRKEITEAITSFANEVQAQSGKHIPTEVAQNLILDASTINP